jgi:methylphosphotriester-DNA--protein-cysteine methyltransferase
VGIPLKSYLTLHQLEKAYQDILNGNSITDAAMNAGFDSPSHFAATVKRLMGLPTRRALKDSRFLKVY